MRTMQQIEAEPEIAPPDAEQVRRWLAAGTEVFPGIYKTPGVCGGDACVNRSRITVGGLIELKRLGCDDPKLLDAYPTLSPQDLMNAWEYARAHPEEIKRQIEENSEENIERLIAEHIAEDKDAAALYG